MIRLERNPENPDHSKWVLIKIPPNLQKVKAENHYRSQLMRDFRQATSSPG